MAESLEVAAQITLGVLIASDKGAKGERKENCLAVITNVLEGTGCLLTHYCILPDEKDFIAATLREWADKEKLDLILTAGGTGCSPRDVTPEALLAVIERDVPGIPAAMRQRGMSLQPRSMLCRVGAGIRGQSLLISLPGSPCAAGEYLAVIRDVLPHAIATIKGKNADDGEEDC